MGRGLARALDLKEEIVAALRRGDAERAATLLYGVLSSLSGTAQAEPMLASVLPEEWHASQFTMAEVTGRDTAAMKIRPPDRRARRARRALQAAAADADADDLPPAVLREEWAAWRMEERSKLRAELMPLLVTAAALRPPSPTLVVLHARALEAFLADAPEVAASRDAPEVAIAHAQTLLAQSAAVGVANEAVAPLWRAVSHAVDAAVGARLTYGLSPPPSAPPLMSDLVYHWPLDGSLHEMISGAHATAGGGTAVRYVEEVWNHDGRTPRVAAAFAGAASGGGGGDASFAQASISGVSLDALSVTVWARLGSNISEWVSIWSFGPPGGYRCELEHGRCAAVGVEQSDRPRLARALRRARPVPAARRPLAPPRRDL